jgi:type II secretory pathway pseudopilin PulG
MGEAKVAAARLAQKRGFTLPFVLAMVVILSLALIAGLSALASLRDETRSSLAAAEFERAAASAEARLEYLMLTEPFGTKGLRIGGTRATQATNPNSMTQLNFTDYLSLFMADGRPYRWREVEGAPDYLAAAQDEAGLVNFGQSDPLQISRLFQAVGLGSDDADQLASELIEYNAEPPPHQPIRKLAELFSLADGRTLISDKTFARIDALAAAHPDLNRLNINTAPREVLKAWFDLSDSQLDQAIKDRDGSDTGLYSPTSIGAQVQGPPVNYVFPGGRLRFTFSDPKTGLSYRSTLVLTPNNQERPIWVENAKTQRLPAAPDAMSDDLEDFPQIAPGAA